MVVGVDQGLLQAGWPRRAVAIEFARRDEFAVDVRNSSVVPNVACAVFPPQDIERSCEPHFPQQPKRNVEMARGEKGWWWRVAGYSLRMPEIVEVVTTTATEGDDHRIGETTPAGSPDTLLIIEAHRRHVGLINGLQRADINTDLHGCRHGQQVNLLRCARDLFVGDGRECIDENSAKTPQPLGRRSGLTRQFLATQAVGRDTFRMSANDAAREEVVPPNLIDRAGRRSRESHATARAHSGFPGSSGRAHNFRTVDTGLARRKASHRGIPGRIRPSPCPRPVQTIENGLQLSLGIVGVAGCSEAVERGFVSEPVMPKPRGLVLRSTHLLPSTR